jgi:hypothetical protein
VSFVFLWLFGPFAGHGLPWVLPPVTPMPFRCVPIFRIEKFGGILPHFTIQFAGILPHFTIKSILRLFGGLSSPETSFQISFVILLSNILALCPTSFNLLTRIFSSEGPRSSRYRRTAALRLIVQPCEKDNEVFPF